MKAKRFDTLYREYELSTKENKDYSTGLSDLDKMLKLRKGDSVLLSANFIADRISMAISFALAAINDGHSVTFINCGHETKWLVERMMSLYTGIPIEAFRRGTVSDQDLRAIKDDMSQFMGSKFLFIDEVVTDRQVLSCLEQVGKGDVAIILDLERIDYRYISKDRADKYYQTLGESGFGRMGLFLEYAHVIAMRRDFLLYSTIDRERKSLRIREIHGRIDETVSAVVMLDRKSIFNETDEDFYEGDGKLEYCQLHVLKSEVGSTGEITVARDYRTGRLFDPIDSSLLS